MFHKVITRSWHRLITHSVRHVDIITPAKVVVIIAVVQLIIFCRISHLVEFDGNTCFEESFRSCYQSILELKAGATGTAPSWASICINSSLGIVFNTISTMACGNAWKNWWAVHSGSVGARVVPGLPAERASIGNSVSIQSILDQFGVSESVFPNSVSTHIPILYSLWGNPAR